MSNIASGSQLGEFLADRQALMAALAVYYKKDDFIMLAKNYETILKPDQIIALFEKLSSEIEDATSAYLHVLFEYEMITKAKEVLVNTKDGEYSPFKALLDLKEAGKHYNLEAISYK